jgi:DNA-binding MarR family transcriptional regulator
VRAALATHFPKKDLDKGQIKIYIVDTMNELASTLNNFTNNEELLTYQTQKLEGLMSEVIGCCEDRKSYESKRFNLLCAEIRCLMLFAGERYLTVKGLAQKLHVAKSRVTRIVDGLMRRGLVERIEDPKDGRIKLLNVTAAGLKKSEEIGAFRRNIYREILARMGAEERRTLLSNLDLLRAAMEAVKADLVGA